VDYVRKAHGLQKIHKMGICQGGTYSAIYAALYPEKIETLSLMVAPFDFSDNCDCMLYRWTKDIDVDLMVDTLGNMPANMLNQAFGMLKPSLDISKYLGIMDSLGDKEKVLSFLRMEKWKADCPDIAGEMFRKYIKDLFRDNKLVKGTFELGGRKVDLKKITMPVLNIYATEDNIIPNASTAALNDYIGSKDKDLHPFHGGHIGVFVGSKSQKELGPYIAEWITKRSK
jgi:polyhydroxyalkanoate synthase